MANGVGRLGGVIMPWLCMYLAQKNLLSPFLLFSGKLYKLFEGLSLLTSLSNFGLPFDTTGKELDLWFNLSEAIELNLLNYQITID